MKTSELRELIERATKGKWVNRVDCIIGPFKSNKTICEMAGNFCDEEEKEANAALIALAPDLAAEVVRLREREKAMVDALEDMICTNDCA